MTDFSFVDQKAESERYVTLAPGLKLKVDIGELFTELRDKIGSSQLRAFMDNDKPDLAFLDTLRGALKTSLDVRAAEQGIEKSLVPKLNDRTLIVLVKWVFTEFVNFDLKKNEQPSSDSTE